MAQERPRALKDAGGIQTFVFDPQLVRADPRAQAAGAEQRGQAFAQRHDRLGRRRQHRRIAPHAGGAVRNLAPRPAVPENAQIVTDEQRSAAVAEVGNRARLVPLAAEAAFQMRCLH